MDRQINPRKAKEQDFGFLIASSGEYFIFSLIKFEESTIQPAKEELKHLTFIERTNFRILNYLNSSRRIRSVLTKIGASANASCIEFFGSNIVAHHGFDNFKKIDSSRGLLIVANHRTFYDQFAIASRLFKLYGPHHNIYFPVRANYFYDNPTGLIVNLIFAMSAMFPPIVRDRKRLKWNQTATHIMMDLLKDPANMVGFHPEGRRNRGLDPYELLPAKPGAGEIVYHANPNVVPVFLHGFPKNFFRLVGQNFKKNSAQKPLVHIVMGQPLNFEKELASPPSRKVYLQISQKIMAAIQTLSEKEKEIRASVSSHQPNVK